MAQYSERYPFDYSARGGTIDELGASYVDEIKRIYQILNDVRENAEGSAEPQPHQLMVSSTGKIYIRSNDNKSWIYLGESEENLGLNSLGFVKKTDIGLDDTGNIAANTTKMADANIVVPDLADGESIVYDKNNNRWVNKKPALINNVTGLIEGSPRDIAGATVAVNTVQDNHALVFDVINNRWVNKPIALVDPATGIIQGSVSGGANSIANFPIKTENIQDGEILVYRPSLGGFVNETKTSGIGAKEVSFVVNGISLASYSGTTTTNVGLLTVSDTEPDGAEYSRPPVWLDTTTE